METGGDLLDATSGAELGVTRRYERGRVAEPPRIRLGARRAGELLELDCRLPLVRDLIAHAEECGDGVEQPAHAGGERRCQLEALADELPARPRHDQACTLEVDGRDAPRLADRRLAAGKWHRVEMRQALEARAVAAQQLAAPERPVGSVAAAVEDERERGALLAVLGQARRGMRMVMLDGDELGILLEGPLRREVLRVQVVGDDIELDVEHREVEREIGAEGVVGLLGIEVAEMRREEGLA